MEEEQVLQQPQLNAYANPMQHYGTAITTLTDPRRDLDKLELFLKGKKEGRNGETIFVSDPLMNDQGINSILGTVQSIASQTTVMGNMDKHEIPTMMDFLADTLAKDLMMNRVKYGITNATARDSIYFAALSTAFSVMKRAFEEGDRRFWKGSQQDIRTTVVTDGNKKGGLFSRLNPWNK
jgi:hypothetical protein